MFYMLVQMSVHKQGKMNVHLEVHYTGWYGRRSTSKVLHARHCAPVACEKMSGTYSCVLLINCLRWGECVCCENVRDQQLRVADQVPSLG